MDGYRKGMRGPLLDYAMMKFKSHRTFPSDLVIQKIEEEYENYLKVKKEKAEKN